MVPGVAELMGEGGGEAGGKLVGDAWGVTPPPVVGRISLPCAAW